ncbi:MAG: ABC transporter ATP-binding protein [Paracoccaceae bacterium]|nr:ABC transporter ATP-binding protein [Paracoccaceae bacterium]MDE2913688.1 ABC transporter ATP-binding protein [Paracoccaceae bacterium]
MRDATGYRKSFTPDAARRTNGGSDAACNAILEVDQLTKRFGAVVANECVSFDLAVDEIHALIGPNGAGKSTLVRQITGELRHDAGTIRFRGRDISHLGAADRARLGLARSFQVSSLIAGFSVLQNVMLAILGRTGGHYRVFGRAMTDRSLLEPAVACLERVGLADRRSLPASDLSHGERRKLEIAVALALEPEAFVLDEPMAGMGPEGTRDMTDFFFGLRKAAPILLIEHDMDVVFKLADRVSVLVGGRIIASGPAAEIRQDSKVRAAYLGDDTG